MIEKSKSHLQLVINEIYLEVSPEWIASVWSLKATGKVMVVDGKVRVGVTHPDIKAGTVVEGITRTAIVPEGVREVKR